MRGMASAPSYQQVNQQPGGSMSPKRERIKPNEGDSRFVRRDEEGKFEESDDAGRSLQQDKQQRAETETESGQGDRGDRKQ